MDSSGRLAVFHGTYLFTGIPHGVPSQRNPRQAQDATMLKVGHDVQLTLPPATCVTDFSRSMTLLSFSRTGRPNELCLCFVFKRMICRKFSGPMLIKVIQVDTHIGVICAIMFIKLQREVSGCDSGLCDAIFRVILPRGASSLWLMEILCIHYEITLTKGAIFPWICCCFKLGLKYTLTACFDSTIAVA